jgi:hypothetical protein
VADANAAPGADTITFAVIGTIRLTSNPIAVIDDLTIAGPGAASLSVSGNQSHVIFGVFRISSAPMTLDLHGLTLTEGKGSGGALFVSGATVNVADTVLSRNTGSGNGGAIENSGGHVTVTDSSFLGNSAFAGGAIENSNGGTLTIARSTFTENTALPGGAIANNGSTVAIVNSTFVGNSAGTGGALYNLSRGTMMITNSTFAANSATLSPSGGAIHNQGFAVTVENSIFAANGCQGVVTDGGGNLDWPDSGCPGINSDPRLVTLADNGGPTQTMALRPGSAAIDAALAADCPATDQRGVARPFGAGCDIGAYEFDLVDVTPPVISVPASVVVNATSAAGAVVSFAASAVDDVDGSVAVACSPTSGSVFPIGTTQVTCTASDAAGNEASASFDVHVKGAAEQLDDLIDRVNSIGPGSSLTDQLTEVKALLAAGDKDGVCEKLNAFGNSVQAQSGKKLTPAEAAELIASTNRIRSVLSC